MIAICIQPMMTMRVVPAGSKAMAVTHRHLHRHSERAVP
jgi:hypothetical protein